MCGFGCGIHACMMMIDDHDGNEVELEVVSRSRPFVLLRLRMHQYKCINAIPTHNKVCISSVVSML